MTCCMRQILWYPTAPSIEIVPSLGPKYIINTYFGAVFACTASKHTSNVLGENNGERGDRSKHAGKRMMDEYVEAYGLRYCVPESVSQEMQAQSVDTDF